MPFFFFKLDEPEEKLKNNKNKNKQNIKISICSLFHSFLIFLTQKKPLEFIYESKILNIDPTMSVFRKSHDK